jgi:hypothetical protein
MPAQAGKLLSFAVLCARQGCLWRGGCQTQGMRQLEERRGLASDPVCLEPAKPPANQTGRGVGGFAISAASLYTYAVCVLV